MLRKDFTPYVHSLTGNAIAEMLNIGFIEGGDKFSSNCPYLLKDLSNKLRFLLTDSNKFRGNVIRGQAACNVCSEVISENSLNLGISELWIPSDKVIYVSPDLIVHYIEKHGYVPPKEYADSVFELDPGLDFNAEGINEELVFS